ncbi:hypothetical protein MLP_05410 [Microlunatus phosphovorus NM-1]|uniref:Uncharacterized protein n=1 Tax=Microlunatus phosphovorus (strain ATCC 700054 / DSM 10555 / JCM 9379 / NBRC 101784 / NCIMB 13414 / VKM Ac-1990 / NM-1) TaxID=1032480 RepID=F5XK59_MICPN|nr:hypothetical protein MLP_05410 [Microlunatus phosphovorus NM-1]
MHPGTQLVRQGRHKDQVSLITRSRTRPAHTRPPPPRIHPREPQSPLRTSCCYFAPSRPHAELPQLVRSRNWRPHEVVRSGQRVGGQGAW